MSTISLFKARNAYIAAAMALTLVSTALPAQTTGPRIQMSVPFAFQVGSTQLAAGTYTLTNPQDVLLSIRGEEGSSISLSQHELSSKPSKVSKAVFHRYGNQYFLREVWLQDGNEYLTCPESKAERRIERAQKEIQQSSVVTPSNVEVALLESPR